MKSVFYLFFGLILFSSCGSGISEDDLTGCWTITYIDTDGVKMKSGGYKMCFNEDGTAMQQKTDGSEKKEMDWTLLSRDNNLIFHYKDGRKPDTMRISKPDKFDLELQFRMKSSIITLYLRKEK